MSRFVISFLAVLAGLTGLIAPGAASAQSLTEALAAAYASNPTLQAARAGLRAIDEGVPQALSGYRPSIEASGSTGYSEIDSSTATDRHQQRKPHTASVTLTQPLYSGGSTRADVSQAEHTVMSARADLLSSEQTVLLAAATAYVDVFRAQAVLEHNINNEQVLKRQLEATRDRFQVGEITRTDVHQAEARLAGATADRIQAEGNLETTRATYRNVIGEAPGKLERPQSPSGLPGSVEAAISAALTQNPAVVGAEFDERAAADGIDSVRGELLPSIDFSGSAGRSLNASGESTASNTYAAKVTLTVPLYQSGSVYSRLRAARETASEKRRLIDQARRDATEQATKAWETLQTNRARITSFEAQVNAAEVALDGVEREAAVGSRTVLDVLDAEQELLDAKVNLVGAERDEMVAVFTLMSALGELTAARLALPVEGYDDTGHYDAVRSKWFGGGGAE